MTQASPAKGKQEFDVFLCHNSKDKPEVKRIAELLKAQGIVPWLDEWELRPGLPWQRALEEQIEHIKTAAVWKPLARNGSKHCHMRLVVEHQDRLTRFGFRYIETVLEIQGRTIEVAGPAENNTEDLLHDLARIVYPLCARLYGQRRAKRKAERLVEQLEAQDGQS